MVTITIIILAVIAVTSSIATIYYKNISEKDGATGAYNKRWFMVKRNSKLVQMMRQAQKDKRKGFGLVLIDMDKFKEYNDTKGHVAGDRLIVDTVTTIKNLLRKGDFIVRIGGDEMAVILNGIVHKSDLDKRMSIMKCKVQSETFRNISTGGVVYTHEMSGVNVDLVMKMADDDMYKDKQKEGFCTDGGYGFYQNLSR